MYYKEFDQLLNCYIVVFICISAKATYLNISKALDTVECLNGSLVMLLQVKKGNGKFSTQTML